MAGACARAGTNGIDTELRGELPSYCEVDSSTGFRSAAHVRILLRDGGGHFNFGAVIW
jgi:hypothetical protein